ncbi:MAG: TIGR02147 family protein [Kofleriaceae bacterium]
MPGDGGPRVFEYADYRAYLRDTYAHRKATQRGFSYRSFARKAGLSSPNYLKLVIDGQRNLAPKGAAAFAVALGLPPREAAFFHDLVAFAQAETAAEKNRAWERLASYRAHRRVRAVAHHEFEYLSRWWYRWCARWWRCPASATIPRGSRAGSGRRSRHAQAPGGARRLARARVRRARRARRARAARGPAVDGRRGPLPGGRQLPPADDGARRRGHRDRRPDRA